MTGKKRMHVKMLNVVLLKKYSRTCLFFKYTPSKPFLSEINENKLIFLQGLRPSKLWLCAYEKHVGVD